MTPGGGEDQIRVMGFTLIAMLQQCNTARTRTRHRQLTRRNSDSWSPSSEEAQPTNRERRLLHHSRISSGDRPMAYLTREKLVLYYHFQLQAELFRFFRSEVNPSALRCSFPDRSSDTNNPKKSSRQLSKTERNYKK